MSERMWRNGAITSAVVIVVLLVIGLTVGGSGTSNTSASEKPSASPSASSSDAPWAWRTIHYDKLKDTPRGYFGPQSPCIKSGLSVEKCKSDLKEALKHDPLELSVWMEQFNLLPGQKDGMSATQLEKLRKAYAAKLEDWRLRQKEQPRVAAVIDSLRDVKIVRLSGPYYSTYTNGNGDVLPIKKVMDPSKNIALKGTMADGTQIEDKLDCHHQPVSKHPLRPTPKPKPHHPHKHHPTPQCTKPPAPGPSEKYHPKTCTWSKPPQSFNCQQNGSWTPGCPPNGVDQPVQNNPCCDTGPTRGAPSSPPPPEDVPSTTPTSGNDNGYGSGSTNTGSAPGGSTSSGSGTQTGNPTPSSSPSPNDGNTGQDHSGGPPPPP